jgi:hypothetical protein
VAPAPPAPAPGQPPPPPTPPAPPPASPEVAAIIADLRRALGDADPDVRGFAARALGKYPGAPLEPLVERTADADWKVAVQAYRALAARSTPTDDGHYARALRRTIDGALGGDNPLQGTSAHVLMAGLDSAGALAAGPNIGGVANEAHDRLGNAPPADANRRAWGMAHCAAAKLVDLVRRWPSRLQRCGHGEVSESVRNAMVAEVVGAVEGANPQRIALLERLLRGGDTRVRAAVAGAAGSIDDPATARMLVRLLDTSLADSHHAGARSSSAGSARRGSRGAHPRARDLAP